MVVSGKYHTLALKADGTVWAWGSNFYGQLGIAASKTIYGNHQTVALDDQGRSVSHSFTSPQQVRGVNGQGVLENVISIAAGENSSYALTADGQVYAWGGNMYGEQGNGTYYYVFTCHSGWYWSEQTIRDTGNYFPMPVLGVGGTGTLTGVVAIAAGRNYATALRNDGTVVYWGSTETRNDNVEYGRANFTRDVALGSYSVNGANYMRAGDGSNDSYMRTSPVVVLGPGATGRLGDSTGSFNTAALPTANRTAKVTKLVGGDMFAAALLSDGTVWAWGLNESGQLGDSTTVNRSYPTQVRAGEQNNGSNYLQGIVDIAAGDNHMVALDSLGHVWTWGANANGQLGDGTTAASSLPVRADVIGESAVLRIDANDNTSAIITTDGSVYGWGDNTKNQLSSGAAGDSGYVTLLQGESIVYQHETPYVIDYSKDTVLSNSGGTHAFTDAVALTVGAYQTTVIRADGSVWAVGTPAAKYLAAEGGEMAATGSTLGNFKLASASTPVQVGTKDTDTIYLGSVEIEDRDSQTAFVEFDTESGLSGSTLKIYNGETLRFYLDKTVDGDGTETAVEHFIIPGFNLMGGSGVQRTERGNLDERTAGDFQLLSSNESIASVSYNAERGSIDITAAPGAWGTVTILIRHIATNTTRVFRLEVIPVLEGTSVKLTAPKVRYGQDEAGGAHAVALKSDGTVWTWGENGYGQLGDGTPGSSNVRSDGAYEYSPVQVRGVGGSGFLTGIVDVAAGYNYTLALAADGTVYAWGDDYYGTLGDGGTYGQYQAYYDAGWHYRHYVSMYPVKVALPAGVKIVRIAAGMSHARALADDLEALSTPGATTASPSWALGTACPSPLRPCRWTRAAWSTTCRRIRTPTSPVWWRWPPARAGPWPLWPTAPCGPGAPCMWTAPGTPTSAIQTARQPTRSSTWPARLSPPLT